MNEQPTNSPPERKNPLRDMVNAVFTRARSVRLPSSTDGTSPLDDMRAAVGKLPRGRIALLAIAAIVVVYLLSGVYVVRPGEVAVVRRFGAVIQPPVGEGLHYRVPRPIDRVDIVNVGEVRRETVGIAQPEPEHPDHLEKPAKLQAITGDTNVIDAEVIVQYQISDPVAYLFTTRYAPYQLVREAVRYAVTNLVAARPVDAILTTDRQGLQDAIRSEAQKRLDAYNSGLQIVGVSLQKAYPPDQVASAFRDVSSAREDKQRAINEAQGYANSLIPEARGQAQTLLSQALAYQSDVTNRAQGAAQAFDAVLAEYQNSTKIYGADLTRYRLYLETIEKILPRAQTYVVNTQNGNRFSLRLFGMTNAPVNTNGESPAP